MRIITALEEMLEINNLATQLRKKHQQQDERPKTTAYEKPIIIAKLRSRLMSTELNLWTERTKLLKICKGEYFQLVTNAESALEAANPSPQKLKRISWLYMKDRIVTTVEEFLIA